MYESQIRVGQADKRQCETSRDANMRTPRALSRRQHNPYHPMADLMRAASAVGDTGGAARAAARAMRGFHASAA
jgi:hypothetical protein